MLFAQQRSMRPVGESFVGRDWQRKNSCSSEPSSALFQSDLEFYVGGFIYTGKHVFPDRDRQFIAIINPD